MIKYLNVLRYAVAVILPWLFVGSPIVGALVSIMLLWMNNYLDDILFYLASLEVKNKENKQDVLLSPVNGIVTKVEKGVTADLITKYDILIDTDEKHVVQLKNKLSKKYDHVAIYLNKFSKHIVLNLGKVLSVYMHKADGNIEMVSPDELIADNVGEYLNNDALIIEYKNCFMVLTMDKYISEYILGDKDSAVSCQICRGSQCDIYFKENTYIYAHEGQCIDVFDNLAIYHNQIAYYNIESEIARKVSKAIEHAGGYAGMLFTSFKKTMCTFESVFMMLAVILLPLFSLATSFHTCFSYVGFSSIYLFLFVRSYRHMMYAIMNIAGYKSWMHKSYKVINKLSALWKK